MLLELRLRNLAIAEDVSLSLAPGLNALTGSTGAGKSLVVEALRWLSGARVDRGMIRRGAQEASAEALFDLGSSDGPHPLLEELGLPTPEDGLLRLRREVHRERPSRAFVGAERTTASILRALCGQLIELQSQHHQLSLRDPSAHGDLLDACGVQPDLRSAYREARGRFQAEEDRLRAWRERTARAAEQRDLLEFQWRELDAARLAVGEQERLRHTVARLDGGARLVEGLTHAAEALEDEDRGATPALDRALRALGSLPVDLDRVAELRSSLEAARELSSEAARELDSLLSDDGVDPAELERAHARLADLEQMGRKYGRTEEELIALRDRLRTELDALESGGEPPAELMAGWEQARDDLQRTGQALHRARRTVARRVAREAGPLLAELGMVGASLAFRLEPRVDPDGPVRLDGVGVDPGPNGPDAVSLVVCTNPGESPGPVERVASGGELSRIGLVLRSLSSGPAVPLNILDEVDAGLGADLGPAMARRLRAMADRGQVLVITHLAPVAAAANGHLRAAKTTEGRRTVARIEQLDAPGRREELARMLGGEAEASLRLADTLLAEAGP